MTPSQRRQESQRPADGNFEEECSPERESRKGPAPDDGKEQARYRDEREIERGGPADSNSAPDVIEMSDESRIFRLHQQFQGCLILIEIVRRPNLLLPVAEELIGQVIDENPSGIDDRQQRDGEHRLETFEPLRVDPVESEQAEDQKRQPDRGLKTGDQQLNENGCCAHSGFLF